MTTSQVRPSGGGGWNNVSQTTNKVAKKDTTYGITLNNATHSVALRALNQWINCGGVGTAATLAQKTAKAVGLQIQEV